MSVKSGYLITEEPRVLVRLVNDIADLAVGIDAADHALLAVNGVGQSLLLKVDRDSIEAYIYSELLWLQLFKAFIRFGKPVYFYEPTKAE